MAKSFWNNLAVSPFSSVLDVMGGFHQARELEHAWGADVNPGVSATLGALVGDVGTAAVGLHALKIPKYARIGKGIVASLALVQGGRAAGANRETIQRLRDQGQEIDSFTEVTTTIGHGASAIIGSIIGNIAAKGIYSVGASRLGQLTNNLRSAEPTKIREFGQAIMSENYRRGFSTFLQMAGIEAGEESLQQLTQNAFNKMIDVRFGWGDQLLESAAFGALGGGLHYGNLRGLDALSNSQALNFLRNIRAERADIKQMEGSLEDDIAALDPNNPPESIDEVGSLLDNLGKAVDLFATEDIRLQNMAQRIGEDPSLASRPDMVAELNRLLYEVKDLVDPTIVNTAATEGIEDVVTDQEVTDTMQAYEELFTRVARQPNNLHALRQLGQLQQQTSNMFMRKWDDKDYARRNKWYNEYTGFRDQFHEILRRRNEALGNAGQGSIPTLVNALSETINPTAPEVTRKAAEKHVEKTENEGTGVEEDTSGLEDFTIGEGVSVKYIGNPSSRDNLVRNAFAELDDDVTSYVESIYITDNLSVDTINEVLDSYGLTLGPDQAEQIASGEDVLGAYIESAGVVIARGDEAVSNYEFVITLGHEFWHGKEDAVGDIFRDSSAEEFGVSLAKRVVEREVPFEYLVVGDMDDPGFISTQSGNARTVTALAMGLEKLQEYFQTSRREVAIEELELPETIDELAIKELDSAILSFSDDVIEKAQTDPSYFQYLRRMWGAAKYIEIRKPGLIKGSIIRVVDSNPFLPNAANAEMEYINEIQNRVGNFVAVWALNKRIYVDMHVFERAGNYGPHAKMSQYAYLLGHELAHRADPESQRRNPLTDWAQIKFDELLYTYLRNAVETNRAPVLDITSKNVLKSSIIEDIKVIDENDPEGFHASKPLRPKTWTRKGIRDVLESFMAPYFQDVRTLIPRSNIDDIISRMLDLADIFPLDESYGFYFPGTQLAILRPGYDLNTTSYAKINRNINAYFDTLEGLYKDSGMSLTEIIGDAGGTFFQKLVTGWDRICLLYTSPSPRDS